MFGFGQPRYDHDFCRLTNGTEFERWSEKPLVIDGVVKFSGRVAAPEEIRGLL